MNNLSNENLYCPNLVSVYRTPKILWYQTDNAIFIRIPLVDVKNYTIRVTCDSFKFSTKVNDIKYFVGMNLCGGVVAEKTSHKNVGREIKLCMIKSHKWTDWPRLRLNKEKTSFIVYDPDHIVKKSWDNPYASIDERESFQDYRKRMNITNIMPPESSSSSSSGSDDENLMGYD